MKGGKMHKHNLELTEDGRELRCVFSDCPIGGASFLIRGGDGDMGPDESDDKYSVRNQSDKYLSDWDFWCDKRLWKTWIPVFFFGLLLGFFFGLSLHMLGF
jgi:hypothetical protein